MLLAVRDLVKHYKVRDGLLRSSTLRAVDGVSFQVEAGSTFALVGESGCGKTTVARAVLRLEPPTAGEVVFDGLRLGEMSRREVKAYRRHVQAVFQDPHASLNPRLRISTIVSEPILAQGRVGRAERAQRVAELLEVVGLPAAAASLFPHEFSGGQRQRIAIARALSTRPRLLVLDEPVSALDVSIRAQILNLLADIQDEHGLTYLVIAHDLALVGHTSDRVGVMYLGNLVEMGPTDEVFSRPRHPYTQALLAAVPAPDPGVRVSLPLLGGETPSALDPPSGCRFHPRCPHAVDRCRVEVPELRPVGPEHVAACPLHA